jgi:hypothetical protein
MRHALISFPSAISVIASRLINAAVFSSALTASPQF